MTPEQREELKPCPFCGDKMDLPIHDQVEWGAGLIYVSCDCGASSPGCKTREGAIAAWNRRAQVEELTVPQWISVKDRLPSPYEIVLGFAGNPTMAVRTVKPPQQGGGFGWRVYPLDEGYSPWLDVSHWMIPAAPTIPAIPGTKEGA